MAQVFLNGGNVDSSGRGINSLATLRTSTLPDTTTRDSRGGVGLLSLLFGLRVSRVLGKRGFVLFGWALATGTSVVNLPSAGGSLNDSFGFCIDSFFNHFVPGVEIPTAFIQLGSDGRTQTVSEVANQDLLVGSRDGVKFFQYRLLVLQMGSPILYVSAGTGSLSSNLLLCCCQLKLARSRRKDAAKGIRFGPLAPAVAKWSSHC